MNRTAATLAAVGTGAVVLGVGVVSMPAALIVGGLVLLALAWLSLDVKEPTR